MNNYLIYLYQSRCIGISIYPSIHPSIHLSIYPSIHLSIYPSIHPSIHPQARALASHLELPATGFLDLRCVPRPQSYNTEYMYI